MVPTHPQHDRDGHHQSPSIFSSWQHTGSTELADNSMSTTAADAARHSVESMVSADAAPSLASSEISASTLGRRGSSAFYTPQSLDVAPHTTTREPWPSTTSPQIAMSHPASIRPAATAQTAGGMDFSRTTLGGLNPAPSTEQSIPPVSDVNAVRSAYIMPMHPGAESIPMSAMYNPTPSPSTIISEYEHNANSPSPHYAKADFECYSRQDAYIQRWSWLYVILVVLSIYSTVLSGIWLVASIVKPRYGRSISTGQGLQITPSTATLLAALAAKTIELSFVTVFVAVLGQVLTRRAFSRLSRGVTLAEMTMRNWVIQPGSLLTHWSGISHALKTFLGALTLTATICALFYTTASDAMVSPKISRHGWEMRDMQGLVRASYANPGFVNITCQTPLTNIDVNSSAESCLNIWYSGRSYHSFTTFMTEWDASYKTENSTMHQLSDRPTGKHNLFDNTTMDSSWIETENGNIKANFNAHKRIINNVTLAMPHPGVYAAATDPINGILQPSELLGIGEYSLRASVVSPVINVMCVNMDKNEVAPLVYTEWPQYDDYKPWDQQYVPIQPPLGWVNQTVVDDLFNWGDEVGRRPPPFFRLYPIDNNMVTYVPDAYTSSIYILAKSQNLSDYTVCELSSWVTPKCSTAFKLSGTSGGYMKAHCEDPNDINAYERVAPQEMNFTPPPTGDWKNTVDYWQLSINLNGGITENNASNARVLTQFILDKPELNPRLPSIAEALAVLATSTLVVSSLQTTFYPVWLYDNPEHPLPTIPNHSKTLQDPVYETFRAQVQTQQYASAHTAPWQRIFYLVLGLVFVLNVLCLLYLAFGTTYTSFAAARSSLAKHQRFAFPRKVRGSYGEPEEDARQRRRSRAAKGLVTDYTEPQNLFALAVNSPPSRALAGSCGHGPDGAAMGVPWRVGYAAGANHYYFFEDAAARNGTAAMSSGADLLAADDGNGGSEGRFSENYKRLSSRRAWL
ncbi:hypothetical protein GQX73_g3327 [Xylaria multiplex]|uniref:Uncharacterized protein n=1 Tax=Xylaria multiplex TaxID=323545 RepID=A0A7C8MV64_9PEZI|nr:hypothetical protein GQX73_g3327 [Xylaria multiplex]